MIRSRKCYFFAQLQDRFDKIKTNIVYDKKILKEEISIFLFHDKLIWEGLSKLLKHKFHDTLQFINIIIF